MTLPVTISGVQFSDQNYKHGVFADGNNFYVVMLDSADASVIEVHKDTGSDSFSEVDSAGKPDLTNNIASLSAWYDSSTNTIHIATQEKTTGRAAYHTFTTASHGSTPDEWVITDELIESPSDVSADNQLGVSISVRSDGDVIVIYAGDEDDNMGLRARTDYARREGGTWTTGVQISADGGKNDHIPGRVMRGGSDLMHFFLTPDKKRYVHRSLNSTNTLGTEEDIDNITEDSADLHPFTSAVYIDDAGTERVRIAFDGKDASDFIALARVDDDTTTGMSNDTPSTIATDAEPVYAGTQAVLDACLDGSDMWVFYADATTSDLYSNTATSPHTTWGATDTEELDAVTIQRLNVAQEAYTRGGNVVIGYIYDDGGTIKYNEKVLRSSGPETVSLAGAVTPAGIVSWQAQITLPGALTPAGAVMFTALKSMAGAITPAGVLTMSQILALSVSGAVTSAGVLIRTVLVPLSGAATSAGTLVWKGLLTLAGAATPSGALAGQVDASFAGTNTPAGDVVTNLAIDLAGAVTSTGVLIFKTIKSFAGAVTSAGTLASHAVKDFAGEITPTGALAVIKALVITLSGAVSPAGTLITQANVVLVGAVTSAGSLAVLVLMTLVGAVASAGAVAWRCVLSVAGAIAPSGAVAGQVETSLDGSVASSGTVASLVKTALSGLVTSAGALVHKVSVGLEGVIAPSGALAVVKALVVLLTGAVTSAGTLSGIVAVSLAGVVTSAGSLVATAITAAGSAFNYILYRRRRR